MKFFIKDFKKRVKRNDFILELTQMFSAIFSCSCSSKKADINDWCKRMIFR